MTTTDHNDSAPTSSPELTEEGALKPSDHNALRLYLLSHVDPHVTAKVAQRALSNSSSIVEPNVLLFGTEIVTVLYPLVREMIAGACQSTIVEDLASMIELSSPTTPLEGIEALRALNPELKVSPPSRIIPDGFAGALHAPDAICDLLLQPLMAFCDLFSHFASTWHQIATNAHLKNRTYLRTSQVDFFTARTENLVRLNLGHQYIPTEVEVVTIP